MTTQKTLRCNHCRIIYSYYSSTYGFEAAHNSDRYCPDCMEAIENVLESIPIKFEKRFIPTNDYTKEQITLAQNERCSEKPLSSRRLTSPLFDLTDPINSQTSVCERMLDPTLKCMVYYAATWWSKNPDKVEIKKEIWYDIEKGCVADYQFMDL
jgi:hypothetical protein